MLADVLRVPRGPIPRSLRLCPGFPFKKDSPGILSHGDANVFFADAWGVRITLHRKRCINMGIPIASSGSVPVTPWMEVAGLAGLPDVSTVLFPAALAGTLKAFVARGRAPEHILHLACICRTSDHLFSRGIPSDPSRGKGIPCFRSPRARGLGRRAGVGT
eukprot:10734373-Heterocapsa_arctica.AAC.1